MRVDVAAVLFDLDGTLIDSAPDLAGTANDMRAARGLAPLPYAQLRLHAGSGARGLLGAALSALPSHGDYAALRDEFHDRYEARMLRETCAFADTATMLDALERRGLRWGIVTNKSLRFAAPMCRVLLPQAQVLVGGDSTAFSKPHPEPLLEAARRLALAPQACVYVGDDLRDMQAGRAAGMAPLAAAWGYLGPEAVLPDWPAEQVLTCADDLLQWLDLA